MNNLKTTAGAAVIVVLAFFAILWYGHSQRAAGQQDEKLLLKPDSAQHQLDSLQRALAAAHATADSAVRRLAGQRLVAAKATATAKAKGDTLEAALAQDTDAIPADSVHQLVAAKDGQIAGLNAQLHTADSTNLVLAALVHTDSVAFGVSLANAQADIKNWKYLAEHRGVSRCGLGAGAGVAVGLHAATPGLTVGVVCRV